MCINPLQAQQLLEFTGHSHAPVAGGTSSTCDDATEVVDVFIHSKAHIWLEPKYVL